MSRSLDGSAGHRRRNKEPGPKVGDRALRRVQLRFALVFAAVAGVLLSIYGFPYAEGGAVARVFEAYLSAYAHVAGALLSLFDRSVSVSGTLINGR